jgi:hypothetical protein
MVLVRPHERSTTKIDSKNSLSPLSHFTEHLVGVFEKLPRKNDLDHEFLRLSIWWLNSTPGIQPAITHTREMAQRNCEQQHYTSSQTLEFRSPAHAGPRERKTAACPAKEFWPRALRFKQAVRPRELRKDRQLGTAVPPV